MTGPRGYFWSVVALLALGIPPAAAAPSVLRVALPYEAVTLDWAASQHRSNEMLLVNLHEGLIGIGPDLRPVPALAERWEILDEGRRIVFHLKPGVKWSDGVPLVAQHFVDGWRRLLSPINLTGQAFRLFPLLDAEKFHRGEISEFEQVGVRAPDQATLEVKLAEATPSWLASAALPQLYPARADLIAAHSAEWTRPGRLVTLGPYVLKAHTDQQSYELERNPFYHGKAAAFDRVLFSIVPDEKALARLRAGELDLLCVMGTESKTAAGRDPRVRWAATPAVKRLEMNLSGALTSYPELRRAIARSIDRSRFAALAPGIAAAGTYAPPGVEGHDRGGGIRFDPRRARKELEQLRNLGPRLKLRILVPIFDENARESLQAALLIQEQLKTHLGIELSIIAPNSYASYSVVRDTRGYDLIIRDWAAITSQAYPLYSRYLAKAAAQDLGFADPRFDQALEKAERQRSPGPRAAGFREADRILTETDAVVTPLYYRSDAALAGPAIEPYRPDEAQSCDLRRVRPAASATRPPGTARSP
jgi:oligopeptide transport system substrate-binding protein